MDGYTGYLTSSGADLSLVFMNVNGYGQMTQFAGSDTQSVSNNGLATCLSCTLTPGTYIISLSTYNTTTTSGIGITTMQIGISTDTNAINTNGFEMSTTTLSHPNSSGYLFANCTQVLNVSSPNTFYLIQKITFTTITVTLNKAKCYIRVTRIA